MEMEALQKAKEAVRKAAEAKKELKQLRHKQRYQGDWQPYGQHLGTSWPLVRWSELEINNYMTNGTQKTHEDDWKREIQKLEDCDFRSLVQSFEVSATLVGMDEVMM